MRITLFVLLIYLINSCSIVHISFNGAPMNGYHPLGKSINCKKNQEIGFWKNDTLIYSVSIYKGKSIIIKDSLKSFKLLKGDTSDLSIVDKYKFKDLGINKGDIEKANRKSILCGNSNKTGNYFMINEKLENDTIDELYYILDDAYNLMAIAENVNSEYIVQYYFTKKKTTTISLSEKDKRYYLDEKSCVKRTNSKNGYIYRINRRVMP